MQMNHVNIPVSDVEAGAAFLSRHFGMTPLMKITRKFALLSDGKGMALALSNFSGENAEKLPRDFHIGFMVEGREAVNAVHARLTEAGIPAPAPQSFHGSWTFYVPAPGGFTVEVQSWEGNAAQTRTMAPTATA
jgi:lactoylglutathione lyase